MHENKFYFIGAEYCGSITLHMDAYKYISRLIKYIPKEE